MKKQAANTVDGLRRESLSNIPKNSEWGCPSEELAEFPSELRKKTGYNHLAMTVRMENKTKELMECLGKLGMLPFKAEDVRRYQKRKTLEHNKALIFAWFSFVASLITTVIFLLFFQFALAIIMIVATAVSLGIMINRDLYKVEWIRIPLGKYNDVIPVKILQKTFEIKTRIPETQFYVRELSRPQIIDPFLEVRIEIDNKDEWSGLTRGSVYVIAQWKEKEWVSSK